MENLTVQDILDKMGLKPSEFYPGKKVVIPLKQAGEYKSHCIVCDWRNPNKISFEVKAGLSGKDLIPKELAKYPIALQTKNLVEFDVTTATKQ